MITLDLPQTHEAESTSEYDERMLYLNGIWSRPGQRFSFRATIRVTKDGWADGVFYWQSLLLHGKPDVFFGREWVAGNIRGRDVELKGLKAEERLALDHYLIHLSTGTDAGDMGGTTQ